MIASFGDDVTEDVFHGRNTVRVRRIPAELQRAVTRKLDMVNAAAVLGDLRTPPANRLEALSGDRKGFHSIRVNSQWRIVFQWRDGAAHDVRIVDYHR